MNIKEAEKRRGQENPECQNHSIYTWLLQGCLHASVHGGGKLLHFAPFFSTESGDVTNTNSWKMAHIHNKTVNDRISLKMLFDRTLSFQNRFLSVCCTKHVKSFKALHTLLHLDFCKCYVSLEYLYYPLNLSSIFVRNIYKILHLLSIITASRTSQAQLRNSLWFFF